jgi:hypothetical protein
LPDGKTHRGFTTALVVNFIYVSPVLFGGGICGFEISVLVQIFVAGNLL